MDEDFKGLHALRVKIAEKFFETEILFQKISEYEGNRETATLAVIGEKICKEARKDGEKLELEIDRIKNSLKKLL